ncbi:MAG: hypothetical protein VX231_04910 [Pseudomonadota bacterium]|nr:hypothetical protein [Pseudomonadota bacterium]
MTGSSAPTLIAEEVTYYIYMEEKKLKSEYCLCRAFEDRSDKYGSLEDAVLFSREAGKIFRVFKKDYGVEKLECNGPIPKV